MEASPTSFLAPAASSLSSPVAPPPALALVTAAPAEQPVIPNPRRRQEAACWPASRRHSRPLRCPGGRLPPLARQLPRPTTVAHHQGPEEEALPWAEGGSGAEGEEDHLPKDAGACARPSRRPSILRARGARGMPALPTSFMGLIQDAEVDIEDPPLEPFGGDDLEEEADEDEEGEDEEEVTELEEEAFITVGKPTVRSTNYSEDEDILLVRAWAHVGLDASTVTDQTGKRYCQRIEDFYCKIKPKTGGYYARSYRSLQGRWELMKPHYARWSAAMDKVKDAPPSGTVESDYEAIADLRYKEMAASNGKGKERVQGRGKKKDSLRKKMEVEASNIREKMEHMMKSRETLAMQTLETKLLINEKKKEVMLAQLEARSE
ncbi:glutathione s-transferase t3-like [Hordeum vulgare]|nr:glutathione s-transferase t3-like [Hordeum vulgare]